MRRAREADPSFPAVVFVHPATVAEGDAHFGAHWPDAAAIADPEHTLYHAFGLGRGTLLQLFGPRVWLAGLRALGGGHGVGRPKGDPLMMSGGFLVRGGRVVWGHYSAHTGDIVDAHAVNAARRAGA